MEHLMTKREREAVEAIRRQKWDRIVQAEPALPVMMRQLNAPSQLTLRGPNNEVMRTIYRQGGGVRITYLTIGKEVIIGKTDHRSP